MGTVGDPATILRDAADLFESRDEDYGDTWLNTGEVLKGLFPDGLQLITKEDFSRYNTLQNLISKLKRYCHNFEKGGHLDSVRDLEVYAAMLEAKTHVK